MGFFPNQNPFQRSQLREPTAQPGLSPGLPGLGPTLVSSHGLRAAMCSDTSQRKAVVLKELSVCSSGVTGQLF